MRISPCRSSLYRNLMSAVIWGVWSLVASSWLTAQVLTPQYGHKSAPDKGPRALGLIQLSAKGKARIIPIALMMDGKFYDAGSYKAVPVPMALDFGIVYEGFRSGVSQGVFTITQPGQLNHAWVAEGTWLPAGEKAPEKSKKYSAPVIEDKDAPPVLHRHSEKPDSDRGAESGKDDKDKDKDKDKDENKYKDKSQQTPATTGPSQPPATPASGSSTPNPSDTGKGAAPKEAAKTATATPKDDEPVSDPNRPRLRRGKPDPTERHEPFTIFDAPSNAAPGTASATKTDAASKATTDAAPVTLIPAISDAGGPDPRPYVYDVKPAEEAIYRNKMLDLAAAQVHARANATAKEAMTGNKKASSSKSVAAKPPKPLFDDLRCASSIFPIQMSRCWCSRRGLARLPAVPKSQRRSPLSPAPTSKASYANYFSRRRIHDISMSLRGWN